MERATHEPERRHRLKPTTRGAADSPLEALLRRDRWVVGGALAALTALCWVYLFWMAGGMEASAAMQGMGMEPRGAGEFAALLLMWVVMMVGMMVPSVSPMVLLYTRVARRAHGGALPALPVTAFLSGYLLVWSAFSLVATGAQGALERAALLSPMLVTTSPALGASILALAGVYQLTPLKHACLRYCRGPVAFVLRHWRPGARGALRMGVVHGAYCVGCCWALMALLFVGGVMNLLWVAAIAIFVLLEKVVPHGVGGGRLAGIGMIAVGVAALVLGWRF